MPVFTSRYEVVIRRCRKGCIDLDACKRLLKPMLRWFHQGRAPTFSLSTHIAFQLTKQLTGRTLDIDLPCTKGFWKVNGWGRMAVLNLGVNDSRNLVFLATIADVPVFSRIPHRTKDRVRRGRTKRSGSFGHALDQWSMRMSHCDTYRDDQHIGQGIWQKTSTESNLRRCLWCIKVSYG